MRSAPHTTSGRLAARVRLGPRPLTATRPDAACVGQARAGKRLPINFYRLVRLGDLTQNVRLRSGEVIATSTASDKPGSRLTEPL